MLFLLSKVVHSIHLLISYNIDIPLLYILIGILLLFSIDKYEVGLTANKLKKRGEKYENMYIWTFDKVD